MVTSKSLVQTAVERKAAEAELKRIVATFAPEHQRLASAARRWLQKRLPTAYEVVYEYASWFVISYSPSERGYEGVLGLRGSADGIRLYFSGGKGLPDPDKLLRGSAQARWVDLERSTTITRPPVVRLVELAIDRNRVPFARTGRGPIIIRSARHPSPSRTS